MSCTSAPSGTIEKSGITICCCTWTEDELKDLVGTTLRSLTQKGINTLLHVHELTGCSCHGADLYWHTGTHRCILGDPKCCYDHFSKAADNPLVVLTFKRLNACMSLTGAVNSHALEHLFGAAPSSAGDADRALNAAAATGFVEAIPFLVEHHGASANELSGYGEYSTSVNTDTCTFVTPLVTAVIQSQHGSVAALLKISSTGNYLALRIACCNLDLVSMKMILAAGADPNGDTCYTTTTPLQAALQNPRAASAVAVLLQHGASPSRMSGTGFKQAAAPLASAIAMGDLESVTLLIDAGACVSTPIFDGLMRTPPMHVVRGKEAPAMYRLLVKAGASVDQACKFSLQRRAYTPLGVAVYWIPTDTHRPYVSALIELGADTANVYDMIAPTGNSFMGEGMQATRRILHSNKNTTVFQRVMIGTSVSVMKGLLRDGIATTAGTTFGDLKRLSKAFKTNRQTHAFARLALGPWRPITHHITHHINPHRATIELVTHITHRLAASLRIPDELWHYIFGFF